jgi:hypothetical protein
MAWARWVGLVCNGEEIVLMKILFLYNSTQTYTSTVFEHLSSFSKYSKNTCFFAHQDAHKDTGIDFSCFDAVVIHYTVRLPYDQISSATAGSLERYKGLKVLLIQDEYDHTYRAWHWINKLGVNLVFTVVPDQSIATVYPEAVFPNVKFVSVLTGYVPDNLNCNSFSPPSQRGLVVGYRGRPLPIRYGELGLHKVNIGRLATDYCVQHDIEHDIAWSENSRIYGDKWYEFMAACRSMLGTESGSNVFDWDGTLSEKVKAYQISNPDASELDTWNAVIQPLERPGLMNQVSPRVFEAIAARTVLVMFEGAYSGVLEPDVHFIPVKMDGSNFAEVFAKLNDAKFVDAMAERTFADIILSKKYSYARFVELFDGELGAVRAVTVAASESNESGVISVPSSITTAPLRAAPPGLPIDSFSNSVLGATNHRDLIWRLAVFFWLQIPINIRDTIKPGLKWLLGRG